MDEEDWEPDDCDWLGASPLSPEAIDGIGDHWELDDEQ